MLLFFYLPFRSLLKRMTLLDKHCKHFFTLYSVIFRSEGRVFINPIHPDISIHILLTLLQTILLVLTRRICLAIKACLVGNHLLYSHDLIE